ncbi:MAG TPA: inositol monophosphatase family protein [Nitrososphaeraceae archaeon]|nr:inositol monophosphatase family protein [Nitrososphaeraceae archaeon]
MIIIDILKDACIQVKEQTKNLIGTAEGNKKFGVGAGGDISRMVDLIAEKAVIDTIKRTDFKPTIIGEECGIIEGDQGYLIMDAIDGTTNASRDIPFYCCSLAYATDNKLSSVVDATIIDLVRGDLYYSSKNKGAYLNGNKIEIRKYVNNGTENELQKNDILIGLNISGASENLMNHISKIISKANHTRHFGANALELCYFARGFMDAYIDIRGKIRSTDIAAAYLIVKESGGRLYSITGSELDAELGISTRLSFLAVLDENMFKSLSKDLHTS